MNEPWLTEGPYTREVLGKDRPAYFVPSPVDRTTVAKVVLLWVIFGFVAGGIFGAACAWARAQAQGVTVIVTSGDHPLPERTDTAAATPPQP